MTDEADVDPLSPDEADAYRALRDGGPEQSPYLEDRVVEALRTRRLLTRARSTPKRLAAAVAAGLILFLVGALAGRSWPAPNPRPAGSRFILFLDDPKGRDQDAEESSRVREYSAWAREQRAAGRLIGGEKLEPTALAMEGEATPVASSGDASMVGGYFVVVADDLAGAVAVARTCPHLRHGGRIIIRPIATL
jgi:hypothetical protein